MERWSLVVLIKILYCVPQMNKNHTGFKRHGVSKWGENCPFFVVGCIVPLSCQCELCVIFKLFIMFVIVLCIIDRLKCALKALPCPLASTPNACWFMSACLRRLAGWGRVEWTRDTEYWERMVDDYQTQFGEGSKTESASNLNLCRRVSMIQHAIYFLVQWKI